MAHYNLALYLTNKADWDGAIAEYSEVLRLDPTDAAALNNLRSAVEHKHNYGEAL